MALARGVFKVRALWLFMLSQSFQSERRTKRLQVDEIPQARRSNTYS